MKAIVKKMIKIDVFSGFLGAGKTTLIKKLLDEAYYEKNIVIIENEFGEIGIDGGFLKDTGIQVNEINSGCICCTLVGDFRKELSEVIERYRPERILIEPSGVAKLSDVLIAAKSVCGDNIEINSAVAVVDASKLKMYIKNFGEFYADQIVHAAAIVMSRTQNITDKRLQEGVNIIRKINSNAPIVTTAWDSINGKDILETAEQKNTLTAELSLLKETVLQYNHEHEHDDHDHHADELFSDVGIEAVRKFKEEEISDALSVIKTDENLGKVLRAKGIVESDSGEWIHFDYIPGDIEIRHGPAATTGRICVIGIELAADRIRKLFEQVK